MKLITILGPTASGKTRLAALLAARVGGEIISADSRQVYRRMDIGTGKDYQDYVVDNELIKYHLIDVIDAGEQYHIAQFQHDFRIAYDDIIARNKQAILCGGSGMYIDAVLRNYEFTNVPINQDLRDELTTKSDEELLEIFKQNPSEYSHLADISTRKRLIRAIEIGVNIQSSSGVRNLRGSSSNIKNIVFGISVPAEIRRERIDKRLFDRFNNGMIGEVESLLASGISAEKLIFYGLEYKFITEYLTGRLKYEEMTERLRIAIHQFSKRQMTYFRGMERKGLHINWLDGMKPKDELVNEILQAL
ncbi:MAG: tRNA (adenosine(37)-N6)-dimethylallyltransferase MiaA [Spirosomataceae bacterium]